MVLLSPGTSRKERLEWHLSMVSTKHKLQKGMTHKMLTSSLIVAVIEAE